MSKILEHTSLEVDNEDNIIMQAEAHQQQMDYERIVRLGHPIEDLWLSF